MKRYLKFLFSLKIGILPVIIIFKKDMVKNFWDVQAKVNLFPKWIFPNIYLVVCPFMSDGVFSYPIISDNILPTWPLPLSTGMMGRRVASQIPARMLLWDFKTFIEELDLDFYKSHVLFGWASCYICNLHCNLGQKWKKRYLVFTILINISTIAHGIVSQQSNMRGN